MIILDKDLLMIIYLNVAQKSNQHFRIQEMKYLFIGLNLSLKYISSPTWHFFRAKCGKILYI
jgi:hypothetical protein